MAISYYTGIPRSGKSLKAVAKIYHTFVPQKLSFLDNLLIKKGLKKSFVNPYENCYTNINQFNFAISDKIYKLDYEELYINLTILHSLYMEKATDEELIEKAKELKLFKSLFVIDEAHNYLKKKEDAVLVWWFTYHAHLYQDIILITQDLKLVNDEYKRTAEYFYRAIPQRLRLNKNVFKYRSYSSYQMYQKDILGTESLKVIPEYFKLYVSGDSPKTKSILHKYLFFILIALLFVAYAINKFFNQFSTETPTETPTQKEITQNENLSKTQTIENSNLPIQDIKTQINQNLKLFKFNCFDYFCYYKIANNTLEIPQNILKQFLLNIEDDYKFTQIKNNRLLIYLLVDEQKFNFINKEVQNETDTKQDNNSSIIPNFSN
jgi:zona occludens toxin